jgi:acyl carrier protein
MTEIGINEVRNILLEVLSGYTGLCEGIASMQDEKLLKINLRDEFGMDSLDFEDMFDELYELYGIAVDMHNQPARFSFKNEPTVENFIETVNYHLKLGA